jgi:predicted O-methyltransferase YrrM
MQLHSSFRVKANIVIETGVAYGWSSLSMLAGLDDHPSSLLISIDMPYPKMNNEDYVGIVVPNFLREKWYLIKEPDRRGILKAIKKINQQVDICHYDSDKSYYGRAYGYPLLWNALRDGGIFISDDIQDNLAFKNFVESKNLIFAVTEYKGKYIGITKK